MKAAIYLRVSTEEQREKNTISTQRQFSERYLAMHNILIYSWYPDDGVSGILPLDQRPEGTRLLADARTGKIDTLYVYRLDRLGRDPRLILTAINEFESLGVQVKSMTEEFDTTNPIGRFLITVLGGVAGLERENTIERSIEGTNRLARQGAWLGGIVPYGFRVVGNGKDSRLVVSEQLIPGFTWSEAEVVRRMYYMAADEQKSCQVIADYLHALGIPPTHSYDEHDPSRGKRQKATASRWSAGHVRNMLTSTTYKGIHRYGRRTKKERTIYEREVPAIVSIDQWERAQQVLHDHMLFDPHGTVAPHSYLLRGLIKCGLCGLTYIGMHYPPYKDKERIYYACNGKVQLRGFFGSQGKKCPSKTVNAIVLETAVWNDIETFLCNPGTVLELLAAQLHLQDEENEQHRNSLAKLQQALQALTIEKDAVITLYRRGRIDEIALDHQLDDIQVEEGNLSREIEDLQEHLRHVQEKENSLQTAKELLERLSHHLEEPLTWELRRQLVEVLVEGIIVDTVEDRAGRKRANVTVTYRFGTSTAINTDTDSSPLLA